MGEQKLPIDIAFNFYSDSGGKDPDSYSPTLKKYHKLLWSKPLPNGDMFALSDTDSDSYLTYKSASNKFYLGSDSISNSYRDSKSLKVNLQGLEKAVENFRNLGSTIGGYILFPSIKINGKMTINGARGFNAKISDRFDLTLECIRLFYLGKQSPLEEVLAQNSAYFELFQSFAGFVNFYLLQDLVGPKYDSIEFFNAVEQNFEASPLPRDQSEYLQYMSGSMQFTNNRNRRINKWVDQNQEIILNNLHL